MIRALPYSKSPFQAFYRHPCILRRSRCCLAAAAAAANGKSYAVIGAGLAGLATAYHLLKLSDAKQAVHVTVFDAVGIGAGGSGAAAGLLHPFAPTGKLLWRAQEAMEAALELLEAAEQHTGPPAMLAWRTGMLRPASNTKQSQAYWKLHQPQQHQHDQEQREQQQADGNTPSSYQRYTMQQVPVKAATSEAMLAASAVDANTVSQLIPGVVVPLLQEAASESSIAEVDAQQAGAAAEHSVVSQQQPAQQQQQQQAPRHQTKQRKKQAQQLSGWGPEASAALHIPGGITLQPLQYMNALWAACQQAAAARQDGSTATLVIQQLHSVAELLQHSTAPSHLNEQAHRQQQQQQQQFDAVVVAAGAAVGSLSEISDLLPLSLCQGYTLDMVPPSPAASPAGTAVADATTHPDAPVIVSCSNTGSRADMGSAGTAVSWDATNPGISSYPPDAPSLLGSPYLASRGGALLVVGATKQHNWTTQQATAELGRTIDSGILAIHQQQLQQQQRQSVIDDSTATAGSCQQQQQQQQQQHPTAAAAAAAGPAPGLFVESTNSPTDGPPVAASKNASRQILSEAEAAEVSAAAQELLSGAAAVWPGIHAWSVAGIRTGVRALPPRSHLGSVPIAGKWPGSQAAAGQQLQQQGGACPPEPHGNKVPVWLLVGLGARGLVYHAWLGKLLARAVLEDDEGVLPAELLAWRQQLEAQAGTGGQ